MSAPLIVLARHWEKGEYRFEAAEVLARITPDALLVRFANGHEQSAFDSYSGIPPESAAEIAALPVDAAALNRPWAVVR